MSGKLERTTARDRFFNYALWEYVPLVPFENKFRSVNLLFNSFRVCNADETLFDIVEAIRDGIGPGNTVWGVKQSGRMITWEFYFYDYGRRERQRSMTRVLDVIKPFASCPVRPNENLFYFMFSMEMKGRAGPPARAIEEIDMYIGNPGSNVSSGICYSLTARGAELKNFYFFFDAKKEMDEVVAKVACSAHLGTDKIEIDRIVQPELRNCRTICVANKRFNDCIYFAGVDIDAFVFFLKRLNYYPGLISFVEENRQELDHLQYDVGFDYRIEGGELTILKSGYYGIF